MKRFLFHLETLTGQFRGNRLGSLVAVSTVMTTAIMAAGLAGPNTWLAAALAALQGADPSAIAQSPDAAGPGAGALPPPPTPGPSPAAPTPAPTPAPEDPTDDTPPPTDPPPTDPPPTTTTPETPEPPPLPEGTRVKHVFVISLDSPGFDAAFGDQTSDPIGAQSSMPYLAETLRPQGLLLDKYSLVDAKSGLPNQIAAISGQPPNKLTKKNCQKYEEFPPPKDEDDTGLDKYGLAKGDGCVYSINALTVADQISSAGLLWRGYAGDMGNTVGDTTGPANCVRPASGAKDETRDASPDKQYVSWRNPFIYFHSLLDLGSCGLNDFPLDLLETDLDSVSTTASYSFIAPRGCDSGAEDPCLPSDADQASADDERGTTTTAADDGNDPAAARAAAADEFLEKWVPQILDSKAYKKDGLLLITFGDSSAPRSLKDRDTVGALMLSQFVTPTAVDSGEYNAYSLLRSTEDFFGFSYLGEARATDISSFAFNALGSGD